MLLMGKLTISMAIFNSYVSLPEGIYLSLSVLFLGDTICLGTDDTGIFRHSVQFCSRNPGFFWDENSCAWLAKKKDPVGHAVALQ